MKAKAVLMLMLAALGLGALSAEAAIPSWTQGLLAIVGRPLTPMSYAGVARRTTRRAVVATGAATMYPGPYYW
jgi:hypothetical protein